MKIMRATALAVIFTVMLGAAACGKTDAAGPVSETTAVSTASVTETEAAQTTVTEATEGDGGAKINVGVLSIGGGLKENGTEQNANTVRFTIPVCLPCTNVLEE